MIYTIGHSNHNIEDFIVLLEKFNINCVCDIRSIPYSKYSTQFNRENLKKYLAEHRILYLYFGNEFGAKREEANLYTNGVLDFEKVAGDKKFKEGIIRIKKGLKQGYRIAIMCTEKNPIDCHRTILVARNLVINGIKVNHILDDGEFISHNLIEQDLIDKYFPNRNQINFFDLNNNIDYLHEAYKKANLDIGYREEKFE